MAINYAIPTSGVLVTFKIINTLSLIFAITTGLALVGAIVTSDWPGITLFEIVLFPVALLWIVFRVLAEVVKRAAA